MNSTKLKNKKHNYSTSTAQVEQKPRLGKVLPSKIVRKTKPSRSSSKADSRNPSRSKSIQRNQSQGN